MFLRGPELRQCHQRHDRPVRDLCQVKKVAREVGKEDKLGGGERAEYLARDHVCHLLFPSCILSNCLIYSSL